MLEKIEAFIKYAEENNINPSSLTEFERWRSANEEIEEFTYTRKEALEKLTQDLYDFYNEEPGEAVEQLIEMLMGKQFTPYNQMTDEELAEVLASPYPSPVKVTIIPRKRKEEEKK